MRADRAPCVERGRAPLSIDMRVLDVQRHAGRSSGKAAGADPGAERGQDPAPRGSPPKMPDLTRLPPGDRAGQIARHARVGTPATSTTSSFVAPSPSAAMARASSRAQADQRRLELTKSAPPVRPISRAPERTVGERDHRVVGRHVAVDGDGVERLVDGLGRAPPAAPPARPGRVGRDEAEHRRHLRMNHPRALGDRRELDRLATDVDLAKRDLGAQVGGADRLRGAE